MASNHHTDQVFTEKRKPKNQIKFKEGMVSGYTLRQAQIQLYQAQNNYLTAMQQLVLAKAKLSLLLTPITPNNK